MKRSDNPEVIYGRDFDDDAITIDSIAGEMGEITIRGQVTSVEAREIRNEKTIYMFNVTDFTDTITVKMFLHNETGAGNQWGHQKGCLPEAKRCDHHR